MVAAVQRAKSWWRRHPIAGWGIIAALVIVAMALSTQGATATDLTLNPNGVGLRTGWTENGFTSTDPNWVAAMNDASDTTFGTEGAGGPDLIMALDDPGATVGAISKITVWVRGWQTTGTATTLTMMLADSTNTVLGRGVQHSVVAAAPAQFSQSWAADPRGGAWTWQDVADLRVAVEQTDSSGTLAIAKMWVVITYDAHTTTNVTLGDGASDPAAAAVIPGLLRVPVDQFSLQRTQGNKLSTVDTVTVTRPTGTASVAVTNCYIYTDVNGNGLIDGSDASIGSATFAGADATVDVVNQQVTDTLANYLVTYDIPPGALANQTTEGHVTAATYIDADSSDITDDSGAEFTVAASSAITVTIGDGANDPASQNIASTTQTNVVLDQFTLQRTAGVGTAYVTSVTVTNTGTDTALDGVRIYRDTNANGFLDLDVDVPLNVTEVTGADPVITFDAAEPVDGTARSYLIVGTTGGANGNTLVCDISAATGTPSAFNATAENGPTFTLQAEALATITVGEGTNPGATSVAAGQTNVMVDPFTLARTGGNTHPTITSLTVTNGGSTPADTVATVDIYRDEGTTANALDAGDTKLNANPGLFVAAGTTAVVTLDDPESVYSTARGYLIVYSFAATAPAGNTANARISAATYTDAGTFAADGTAGTNFTINATAITVTIGDGANDPASQNIASTTQTNVVLDQFTLQRTAGVGTAYVTSVTVTNTGTDTALDGVRIYRDTNANGFLDLDVDVPLNVTEVTGADPVITFDAAEPVDGTARSYLIVGTTGGANGNTLVCDISTATAWNAGTFTATAENGPTFTLQAEALATITVGEGTNPGATSVAAGQTNVMVDPFTLARTGGNTHPTITSLTVTNSGTGVPAATIASVDIYRDGGTTANALDAGDTKLNSVPGVFVGTTAAVTLDDPEFVYLTARGYLVVYTFTSTAIDATTANARISAATHTGVQTFTADGTAGATFTVNTVNVTIGDVLAPQADPGPANVLPNATGVVVDRFRIERTNGTEAATVTTLRVTNIGASRTLGSTAYIYADTNDDGVPDGASLGSAAFYGAIADINITDQTVGAIGTRANYLVVVDVGAASDGETIAVSVTAATGTGTPAPVFTYSDTANTFTVRTAAQVTIGNGTADPAAADTYAGQTGVIADRFRIERTAGTGTASVITATVTNAGTAPGTAHIWTDANNDGSIAGETDLGSAAFAGGVANINITDQTVGAAGAPLYYIVTVDVGVGATDGQTVIATVTTVTGSGTPAPVFTYSDTANTFTVRPTIVVLGDGANDSASDVWAGQTAVAVDQFTLQRAQGSKAASVNSVTVTKTGTAAIANVYIYSDGGTLGVIDGADAAIASGTFGGGSTATVTINQSVTDTLASYLVVYDIPGSATDGQWTTAEITNATYTNADTFTESDNQGFQFTVRDTNVTLGDGANDPAAAGVTVGRTNVPVDQFTLRRAQGAKAATVGTVTVTKTGTIAVSAVRIYSDGGTFGVIDGADASIASGTFTGATATLTINQSVTDALASYLVVYDIPAGAVLGQTTTGEITAATYVNVDNFTESDDVGSTFTVVADGTPPSDPTNVGDAPGAAAYTIASIWWNASTDNIGVAGYRIYRAANVAGPFVVIGTSATARGVGDPWLDTNGVAGQDYWYKVSAFDAVGNESGLVLAVPNPVRATWTVVPHDTYDANTRTCRLCHAPHEAATSDKLYIDAGEAIPAGSTASGQAPVCYICHDGSGAKTNVKVGAANSFALSSGHVLEAADATPDLTNTCSSCHSPHKDVDIAPMAPAATINGVAVGGTGNAWCGACHNASADWYKAGGYAALLVNPSRDATGYPTAGTYPGTTVYQSAGSPHGNTAVGQGIPAGTTVDPMITPAVNVDRTQGDCLWCHSSHRSVSAYDGLNAQWRPTTSATLADDQTNGTYAAACFTCHGGDAAWIAKGANDIKQYVTAGGPRSGHRIESAGAYYPIGAPLACYECHNPHGSAADKAGLSVMTMTDGTTRVLLGDMAGEIDVLDAGGLPDAAGIRKFCFSCHTTAGDVSGGNGFAYGWNGSAYAQITSVDAKVAGVSRIAYDPVGKRGLKLPAVNGHYRDNTQSCSQCHGNIHNPSPGLSDGGVPCYGCHSTYQKYMEDNVGTAKGGIERLSTYHHVLGGTENLGVGSQYYDGDVAPGPTGTYPTLDIMTPDVFCVSCHVDHDKFNAAPGANLRTGSSTVAANSDFIGTEATGGICTSCHGLAMPKDTVDQKAGTTLAQSVTPAAYDASAHQYKVASTFGVASTFQADCSKCHNDEQAKEFATSTYKFGTHWSQSNRIISAFGGTVAENLGEAHCLKCHTGGSAGNDYFGAQAMTAIARNTDAEFALTGSTHDLTKVECVNCHNVHEATAAVPVADPDNTYTPAAWTTTADKNTYCLKCHDGTMPSSAGNSGTTFVPYDVLLPTAPADPNVGAYNTSGHGATSTVIACRTCHEQHGSSLKYLLASPVDSQNVTSYSLLPDGVGLADQKQCLACHRSGGVATTANISRYYPASAGGTATAAMTRSGHRIFNGTYAGDAVPCRACHDPHGGASGGFMLAVRTQIAGADVIIGDGVGELAMSAAGQASAINVRNFCFACHTTYDAGLGWNGSSMAAVSNTSYVLGINRVDNTVTGTPNSVLRLPNRKGHTNSAADQTYSCYLCHGDDFTQSNSVNVHNPAKGGSSGGEACYQCHTVYRTMMEDSVGTETGSDTSGAYHHVLGGATAEGDKAFTAGTFPGAGTDVYCMSCHVDHNSFNTARGTNLRAALGSELAAATDFNGTSGVCTDCHSVARSKDPDQRQDGTTQTPVITAGQFGASAHDYATNPTSTFTGASGQTFTANCSKCHDSEIDGGGMEGGTKTSGFQTSTNKFSVHYSANRRILAAMGVTSANVLEGEGVCYKCHSGAGPNDYYGVQTMDDPSRAIPTPMSRAYKHNVALYSGLHKPSPVDEGQAYLSGNKHVECEDCHNVHAAGSGTRTVGGVSGNAIAAGSPIQGVSGVTFTSGGTNWSLAGASLTRTDGASKEYQICFKCHSSANTALSTWDDAYAEAWTDQALEFSSANASYHPVVQGTAYSLATRPLSRGALTASWMLAPWNTNMGTQTMMCSDCHGDSATTATSQGPHGSAAQHILKGPNTNWPTNASGVLYEIGRNRTNNAHLAGLFCMNCHVVCSTTGNYNHVHATHEAQSPSDSDCIDCHILVPHGGKLPRLLATNAYNSAGLPLRYAYGGNRANVLLSEVRDVTAGWAEGDCYNNPSCNGHSTNPADGYFW